MREQEVAGLFDATAARYDEAYEDTGTKGRQLRDRQATALALLGEGPGIVLEAGLGPGRLCVEACARGWRAVGVDISYEMVALAKRRVRGLDADALQGSAMAFPFADASFDAVTAIGLYGYLPDGDAFVREAARLLRPGGRLVVSVPNFQAIRFVWRNTVLYPSVRFAKARLHSDRPPPACKDLAVTRRELEDALHRGGLVTREVRYTGFGRIGPSGDQTIGISANGRVGATSRLFGTEIVVAAER